MRHTAICAAILLFALDATAEQMTLYNVASDDRFVELGKEGGAGDMILWNSEVQDEAGKRVGVGAGTCIRLDPAGNHFCNMTIHHDGRGAINASGMQVEEPMPSALTIVGGTGDYEGITGTLRSTPVEDRARFKYELDYRVD